MTLPGLFASVPGPGGYDFVALLIALVGVLFTAKVLGDLFQRMGQSAVLGELLGGVLLGPSLIGILNPADPVVFSLAELGLLILLFEIGLHTDLRSIVRVGAPATAVGLAGVIFPFAGGYLAMAAMGITGLTAIVICAALTATSIGISARVLADLGQLDTREGSIVLGAAVLDDVIGLILLSVVSGVAAGGTVTFAGAATTTAIAVGFLVAAIVVGLWSANWLLKMVSRMRVTGALGALSLAFALTFAVLADKAGSAMIIGAFAAGLVLHATPSRREIERAITRLGHVFVPIFFASVGAAIDLGALADPQVLLIGGVLSVVAILGKLVAGFAPLGFTGHKMLVGVAMVPRGEVGLIFAQMGFATGALDAGLFGAVVLMVMVTTFVAPPWLGRLAQQGVSARQRGGLTDLVAGEGGKSTGGD